MSLGIPELTTPVVLYDSSLHDRRFETYLR